MYIRDYKVIDIRDPKERALLDDGFVKFDFQNVDNKDPSSIVNPYILLYDFGDHFYYPYSHKTRSSGFVTRERAIAMAQEKLRTQPYVNTYFVLLTENDECDILLSQLKLFRDLFNVIRFIRTQKSTVNNARNINTYGNLIDPIYVVMPYYNKHVFIDLNMAQYIISVTKTED